MKIIKIFTAVVLLISFMTFYSFAEDNELVNELFDKYSAPLYESLDDDTLEMLSQIGIDELNTDSIFDLSFSKIIGTITESFSFQFKENLSSFFKILSAVLILILLSFLLQENDSEIINDVFSFVVIILISSMITDCVKLLSSVFTLTKTFMIGLTPIITVLLSLSGNITFSALYSSGMIGFCQLISFLSDEILIPFTGIYFGLTFAMNFNEVTDAQKLSSYVNKAITAILGTLSTFFSLFLCAKNIISKDIDSLLFSSGKYIISNFIPVVGGAVSGVLNSVIGAIGIVKSTIGIFAIIACLCINLPLFVKIIFCRIMLGMLSFFCEVFEQKGIAGMIKTISQSINLLGILAFFEMITLIVSTGLVVSIRGNL